MAAHLPTGALAGKLARALRPCHHPRVTTGRGDNTAGGAGSDFLRDWAAVRHDSSIQFAPIKEPEPEATPQWLENLLDWLGDLFAPVARALAGFFHAIGLTGPAWPWIGGALLAALLAFAAWRWWPRERERGEAEREDSTWSPERGAALGLLEDADRLASEGRYGDAAHLLLQRSVRHISEMRPDAMRPSFTARDIAALPVLSEGARAAFAAIAERVERSLFALRPLDAGDWQAAREAYAYFALGRGA
ncbi:hypothetical protein [Croceibacterium aestuarii]|uniref:hypothetical protein n=1 Tax=Croceibacterium aestuarii TaxID=3064139 RepID=UPI00272E48CE|nr:hypothetical protein [Croceibacterium sp. D39]